MTGWRVRKTGQRTDARAVLTALAVGTVLWVPFPASAVGQGSAPMAIGTGPAPMQPRIESPAIQRLRVDAIQRVGILPPAAVGAAGTAAAVVPAAPSPTEAAAGLTPETMATAPKPAGFTYTIIREGIVDELADTYLYVKANKDAKTTSAVPVPKNRELLATCLAGGTVDDLVRGATVAVKYDPKGVVRPEIVIGSTPQIEVLDDAKIMDRGGSKLYVITADKQTRGFEIEGGAAAWASVVQNGTPDDLKAGTLVRIEYDPSGREGIKITLKNPPVTAKPGQEAPGTDKGCGCRVAAGPSPMPMGAGVFGLGAVALLWLRRSRPLSSNR